MVKKSSAGSCVSARLPPRPAARVHDGAHGIALSVRALLAAGVLRYRCRRHGRGRGGLRRGGQGRRRERQASRARRRTRPARAKARGPVRENDLPGDPHWNIRHLGAPDAIVGYAGQASVLPGEPITLYVSTTARSFRVSAFRMGWYHGDEARLLWKSGTVPGAPAAPAGPDQADQHGGSQVGPVADRPHPRLAGGLLPAPAGRGERRPAVRAGDRPVGQHRRQDRDQERRGDLAGLQHLGRLRPVQRARRGRRLRPTGRSRSAWTGRTTPTAPTCSCTTSGRRSSWPSGPACRWPTSPAWTSTAIRTCWTGPTRCSPGATTSTGPRRSGRTSRRPGTRA